MAVSLEYGFNGSRMKLDDSIIFSSCSSSKMQQQDVEELFNFHLNYDGTFDLSTGEFYDSISLASTPSTGRSYEFQQRRDYDTDDSGFCESLVSDGDLPQMSTLRLGDDINSDDTAEWRCSDRFPLPRLCLLSRFDEDCPGEDSNALPLLYEQCETLRKKDDSGFVVPSERASVRRQRSPDAVVKRCSRHRLSLDSFSESSSISRQPIRRSSDSFVVPQATEVSNNPSSKISDDCFHPASPSTALDDKPQLSPLNESLPSDVLPSLVAAVPLSPDLPKAAYKCPQNDQSHSEKVFDFALPHTSNILLARDLSPAIPTPDIPPVSFELLGDPTPSRTAFQLTPLVDRTFSPSAKSNRALDPSPASDVSTELKDRLQCLLLEFAPSCLGQLIGRKMGLHYVDIIAELYDRSMSLIIRHICDYITDADISSLLLVSTRWNSIITADRRLKSRVKAHNSQQRLVTKFNAKENMTKSKTASTHTRVTRSLTATAADVVRPLSRLTVLTNQTSSQCVSGTSKFVNKKALPCSRRARRFWKEAENLYSGETLAKCPRCGGPSRADPVQERGQCATHTCRFDFCLLCLMSYHSARQCGPMAPSTAASPDCNIGSRKSRRQLRRL